MSRAPAPLWRAAELAAATGAATTFDATGVSIDSRTLAPGDLFVALVGDNGDGHDHVADALARGAAGALVHKGAGLRVPDTRAALQALGAAARARFAGRIVAVTGSVGKTTTKEMLRTALSAIGATHAADASYNNHWGVPLTLARMPADAAFAVAEIGTNHPGEIAPLSRLVRPHLAIITGIAAAHLGHFGSLAAIAAEKATILHGLEANGIAVLPADDAMLPVLRQTTATLRSFGAAAGADARLLDRVADAEGSDITAMVGGRPVRLRLNAPGGHMAMNALATLATVDALGLDVAAAAAALAAFAPVRGRGVRRRVAIAGGSALLLDESYNASAASVRAALDVLALQPATRRLVVLGDMLELGAHGPAEHSALAPSIASVADMVFTCGTLTQRLHESLPQRIRTVHADDSAALAPAVVAALRPGDAVLVKGSLGSRMARIVAAIDAAATMEAR